LGVVERVATAPLYRDLASTGQIEDRDSGSGVLTHIVSEVMHPELGAYAGDGRVYALAKTGQQCWNGLLKMEVHLAQFYSTMGTQSGFDKLTGMAACPGTTAGCRCVRPADVVNEHDRGLYTARHCRRSIQETSVLELTTHHQNAGH
jgi:DEAD/DEAH box helicase domain-containing protein